MKALFTKLISITLHISNIKKNREKSHFRFALYHIVFVCNITLNHNVVKLWGGGIYRVPHTHISEKGKLTLIHAGAVKRLGLLHCLDVSLCTGLLQQCCHEQTQSISFLLENILTEDPSPSSTFQLEVNILPEPGINPVAGGIFWNGVFSEPASTGVLVEIITWVDTEVQLTENGAS